MSTVNLKLLPLKLIFVFLYGALGCLLAFITNHMFHIGLSHEEVTWINTIIPLTSLVGPPAVGYLADRLGHYKLITIITMALAAVFSTALLYVPEQAAPSPTLVMFCGQNGSSFAMQSCDDKCPQIRNNKGTFRITECREVCGSDQRCDVFNLGKIDRMNSSTHEVEDEASTDSYLPFPTCHERNTPCNVFVDPFFLEFSQDFNFSHGTFKSYFSNDSATEDYPELTCDPSPNCVMACGVDEISALSSFQCSSRSTFWLYFCLRAIFEMLIAVVIALLDAVILTMVAQHGGDYGRQKMFGFFALGISGPVVGYLMDKKVFSGSNIYGPVFYTFDILMLCTALITICLPFKVDVQRTSLLKNLSGLIRTVELNVLFLIVIILGTLWGFSETFVFPHMLTELQASQLVLGLTVSAGVFPSIPFLYKSDAIIRICGHHYLLILAFVGYCVKYAGLAYITNPNWIILLECSKVITLNLMQVATATFAYKLAPKTLVATAQGIVWMAHFNVGRSIGTIVGGYLSEIYSMVVVFSGASVLSAICAIVYLALHQLVKYLKEKESRRDLPSQVKTNGNIPNGVYKPLQMSNCES